MSSNNSLPKKYEAAFDELQSIAQRFESETVSIDELSGLVSRAAVLLKFCQDKLRATEGDVQGILSQMGNAEE